MRARSVHVKRPLGSSKRKCTNTHTHLLPRTIALELVTLVLLLLVLGFA